MFCCVPLCPSIEPKNFINNIMSIQWKGKESCRNWYFQSLDQNKRSFKANPTKCFSVFDHFVGLAIKGLKRRKIKRLKQIKLNESISIKFKIFWKNSIEKHENFEVFSQFLIEKACEDNVKPGKLRIQILGNKCPVRGRNYQCCQVNWKLYRIFRQVVTKKENNST